MVPCRSASTWANRSSPACSRSTSPSRVPSERTSRRSGASFRSPDWASNSARRCDQLSGFHKRAIVFRLCTIENGKSAAEAGGTVVIDHPRGLHEGIDDDGAYEFKTALFELLRHL